MQNKPMKKILLINLSLAIGLLLLSFNIGNTEERNPFKPYIWSGPANNVDSKTISKDPNISNPLTEKPLSSFTVIGVAISPTDSLAILKSRDKQEYFAYIGDDLGSEGGKIEDITPEGVSVNVNDKIIPLKVSNRFDTKDEKAPEEKEQEIK